MSQALPPPIRVEFSIWFPLQILIKLTVDSLSCEEPAISGQYWQPPGALAAGQRWQRGRVAPVLRQLMALQSQQQRLLGAPRGPHSCTHSLLPWDRLAQDQARATGLIPP